MKNLILIATAAAALLAADIAAAQTPGPPPGQPGAPGPGAGQRGFGPPGGGPFGGRFGGFRRNRPTADEIKKRTAAVFAELDVNHDGKVTLQEFRADLERRKLERQKAMFDRFSGGQDSFTLDQLNARVAEQGDHGGPGFGRGRGGPRGPGGPGRGPGGPGPGPGPGAGPPAR